MRSHRWAVVAAIVQVLVGTNAMARDHLVPDESVIGGSEFSPDYQMMVHDALSEAYDRDVKARLVIEPSFAPETAIVLKEDKGSYQIVTLQPAVQLWTYESLAMIRRGEETKVGGGSMDKEVAELEKTLPANFHDVKIVRCEVSIEPSNGKRILHLWERMLLATRFDQPNEPSVIVTDGDTYHFSAFSDLQFLSGQTHSPGQETGAGMLVEVGDAMFSYCEKRDAIALTVLNRKISRLEEHLRLSDNKS